MRSVFWALVRKDVYLLRGFMIATIGTGVLSVVLASFGGKSFAVGGILFLTANVASGIFTAMYSLMVERKERSRAFALSLPISGVGHEQTKLVSGYLAFGFPWLVLTGLAVGLFLLEPSRLGMVVYVLVLQGFVLALFSVILTSLFVATSEAMSGLVILFTNICFSLFMVTLGQPEISGPMRGPQIVWTPFAIWMTASELLVIALSIAFATVFMFRKRDYV